MLKEKIVSFLKKELKQDVQLNMPPSSDLGDFSLACFKYSKEPQEIAGHLAEKLRHIKGIKRVEVVGPYLNIFINKEVLAKEIITRISKERDKFGSLALGKKKTALIEHTSINPNASPHVGRVRNAIIGDSLTRLLRFQGYKTQVHYFVNNVGKQIAMLVLGCKKNVSFDKLLGIYISINKRVEKDKDLEKNVFELLNKFESGDKKTIKKFKQVVSICIQGQLKILNEFGIYYNFFDYESKYLGKKVNSIIERLEKTGKVFKDAYGRKVLDQAEFNFPIKAPCLVLTRADGTSLYALRDIAYHLDKVSKMKSQLRRRLIFTQVADARENHAGHRNIIVLGEDHKMYHQQIKAALSLLNVSAPEAVFYSFVLLKTGKMSTRQGNLVLLEDFMREAKNKALNVLKQVNIKDQRLAKAIGYGAIKYSILKVSAEKNIIFDWGSALSFEGDSAPYIQYTHARANSILKKAGVKKIQLRKIKLTNPVEFLVVKELANFPDIVKSATVHLKPHLIANYLSQLAQKFNEFYHACPCITAEKGIKETRLALVAATKQTLKNGLGLLGIDAPERM